MLLMGFLQDGSCTLVSYVTGRSAGSATLTDIPKEKVKGKKSSAQQPGHYADAKPVK